MASLPRFVIVHMCRVTIKTVIQHSCSITKVQTKPVVQKGRGNSIANIFKDTRTGIKEMTIRSMNRTYMGHRSVTNSMI